MFELVSQQTLTEIRSPIKNCFHVTCPTHENLCDSMFFLLCSEIIFYSIFYYFLYYLSNYLPKDKILVHISANQLFFKVGLTSTKVIHLFLLYKIYVNLQVRNTHKIYICSPLVQSRIHIFFSTFLTLSSNWQSVTKNTQEVYYLSYLTYKA